MRGYLADLYAGTILFILGLTPGKLVHDEGERILFKWHSPTFSPPRNIFTSTFGYFFINSYKKYLRLKKFQCFLIHDFILLLMKSGVSDYSNITHCLDYLQVIMLRVSKLWSPECKECCHYPPDLVNRTVSHTETKDTPVIESNNEPLRS